MSNAIIGTGILLKAGDGASPENFTTVAEIVSLKPPALTRKEIEVSTHNEGVDAKILGMLRRGPVTAKLNWIPADPTHSDQPGGIYGDFLNNVKRNWRITYPPSGFPYDTFAARVSQIDPQDVTTDAALQITVVLTIDGDITRVDHS